MFKNTLHALLFTFLGTSVLFSAAHLISDPDYCSCTLLARMNGGDLELSCGGNCTEGNCLESMFDLEWNSCQCPDQPDAQTCNCFGLRGSDEETRLVYDC